MTTRKKTARGHKTKRRDVTKPLSLTGLSHPATQLELSLDGSWLFSSGSDARELQMWDLRRPSPRSSTICRSVHDAAISSFVVLARSILTAALSEVAVWDRKGNTCTRVVNFEVIVEALFVTPSLSHDYLGSVAADGVVWLWNVKRMAAADLEDPDSCFLGACDVLGGAAATCGCASRHLVFASSTAGQVSGFNPLMENTVIYNGAEGETVVSLVVSNAGDALYAATAEGSLLLWDVDNGGAALTKYELHASHLTLHSAASSGVLVVADGLLMSWSGAPDRPPRAADGCNNSITSVAAVCSNVLLCGTSDGTIRQLLLDCDEPTELQLTVSCETVTAGRGSVRAYLQLHGNTHAELHSLLPAHLELPLVLTQGEEAAAVQLCPCASSSPLVCRYSCQLQLQQAGRWTLHARDSTGCSLAHCSALVLAGPCSAARSEIEIPTERLHCSSKQTIRILSRDECGNVTSKAHLSVYARQAAAGNWQCCDVHAEEATGEYACQFTAVHSGRYELKVTEAGQQLSNSPATFTVHSAAPQRIITTVDSAYDKTATIGCTVTFPLAALDAFQNHCPADSFADMVDVHVDVEGVSAKVVVGSDPSVLELHVTSTVCAQSEVLVKLRGNPEEYNIRWLLRWVQRVPRLPAQPRTPALNRLSIKHFHRARGAAGCFNREVATQREQPLTWRSVPKEPKEPRGAVTARPRRRSIEPPASAGDKVQMVLPKRTKLPAVLIGRAPV